MPEPDQFQRMMALEIVSELLIHEAELFSLLSDIAESHELKAELLKQSDNLRKYAKGSDSRNDQAVYAVLAAAYAKGHEGSRAALLTIAEKTLAEMHHKGDL